jgi:hypothetical protein
MPFVATDWSIALNGDIRYIGDDHNGAAPSYATVIELHRALQDFADDAAASGDDLLDITSDTPSQRSTDNIITLINGFNVDATAIEHLYDGTIEQGGGAERWDGITNFGNPEVELGILQNGTVPTDDWWNLGGAHGTATGGSTSTLVDTSQSWTVDEWVGYVVRNTTDGSQGIITSNTSDTLTISDLMYGGTNNTNANTEVYYIAKGLNASAADGISHRFMLKTVNASSDIDNRKIIGFARTYGNTFAEFTINATSPGINVLAVSDGSDLNNTTAPNSLYDSLTTSFVSPFDSISNLSTGYVGIDVNNDTTDEFYYSQFDYGTASTNQFYEYSKYVTRYKGETGTTITYGLNPDVFRGITTELTVTGIGGTWVEPESVSWTGGTGQVLAVDNTAGASTTAVWIQVLTGSAPTSGTITGNGGATATVTAATSRALSQPFTGQSTGSAIIGGYGLGISTSDLGSSDLLTALDGVAYQPPNNVTFSVGGLVIGEDRVLVAKESGGGIDTTQYTLNGTLNTAGVGTITVNQVIDSDTPSPGVLRLINDSGFEVFLPYTSFSGSDFTLTGTYDFNGADENDAATTGNGAYVGYIDKLATATTESFTVVYSADIPLFIRVRDGGGTPIVTFETTGTLTDTGGSTTAIRTSDA